VSGNEKAARRVAAVKKVLEEIGIEPERVEMFHNSAAMGPQFAQTCIDFTERIRKLGPLLKGKKKAAA
jgi:coenzyme F420-reducing hydrogenase delta subunit